ncbi:MULTISPECIES: HEAT repeat domain-containing protein [unclassified Leptolyngbya]|uniref:HEAT repeat domain-containing protein n=1 Tax=unclassified Leptolyngbya TaxID=2650499 RepID=UPI00168693E1|nr:MULTISPECIES: HEAT repeat domain-containing protein [unclassified Leptolyngbya]MBD1911516.1 HEAT repeat domain-containing protein [Leptolyngbya sp. FACHB-8]MBD2155243.1 HEAT repeat domain-containing protein [Leptolyngbya sp. FACHB-16]
MSDVTAQPNLPNLEEIATQLESENSRDRLLGVVALRDIEPEQAVPLIKKVLDDDNLQVKSMAVFALGLKPTAECYPLLTQIMETDPDYSVRAGAAGALGYLQDSRAVEPLMRTFYEDTDWLVRFSAAVSLGNLKDPKARNVLLQALESDEVVLHQAAIAALGEIRDVESLEAILRFAQSSDWLVRQRLAEALGNMPSTKAISALKYLEKDSHPNVAAAAHISLQHLTKEMEEQTSGEA